MDDDAMDEENSQAERQAFVDSLAKDEEEVEQWINGMLTTFGWDKEAILQQETMGVCPLDPGHQVPLSSLAAHTEVCRWRKKGFIKEDMEKVPSSEYFYEKSTTVVQMKIDERTQAELLAKVPAGANGIRREVPLTSDQAICEMTPLQRMAIYDYCVSYARDKASQMKISDDDLMFQKEKDDGKQNREKSRLELRAEERDQKRRRKSYRAKNVHITRKSTSEVLREVITSQMDMLAEMWKDDREEEERAAAASRKNRRSRSQSPRSSRHESRSPGRDRIYKFIEKERDRSRRKRNYHSRSRSRSHSRSRRIKRERSWSREKDDTNKDTKRESRSREREIKRESRSPSRNFRDDWSSSRSRSRSKERKHKHKKHKKHKHKHKHKHDKSGIKSE